MNRRCERDPFLHLFVNIEITHEGERLEMRMPIVGEEATLRPLGRGRFPVEGGLLHGATALIDGDHLFAHMIRGRRVAAWETAIAFIVYAGLVALAVVSVPGIVIWRWVRRRQTAARSSR